MFRLLTLWRKTYEPFGWRFTVPWFALLVAALAVGTFVVAERIYGPF